MDVKWVVHRMVGVHFIHQPNLHLLPNAESPVDRRTLTAGLPIEELPPHVAWIRHAVHIDHIVFPFDASQVARIRQCGWFRMGVMVDAFMVIVVCHTVH